jgi:hypothetical protein
MPVIPGPATRLPPLVNHSIPPARRDRRPHLRPRHKRRVAPAVYARCVEVEVERAQLPLQLLLHSLPDFFGARVGFEEEGELFEGAAVGFGEEEVLQGVSRLS